jgi:hypothetical protein
VYAGDPVLLSKGFFDDPGTGRTPHPVHLQDQLKMSFTCRTGGVVSLCGRQILLSVEFFYCFGDDAQVLAFLEKVGILERGRIVCSVLLSKHLEHSFAAVAAEGVGAV